MIEIDINAKLATDATIGVPVYPVRARATDKRPYITVERVSDKIEFHMLGVDGLACTRLCITCQATDYETAKRLNNAVIALLNGFRGQLSNYFVQGIHHDNSFDDCQVPMNSNDVSVYLCVSDFKVWYGEQ